jgi:hypothetical protein
MQTFWNLVVTIFTGYILIWGSRQSQIYLGYINLCLAGLMIVLLIILGLREMNKS